jgi:pyruvate dehydrogenase complex dehydrogenase (E1) component
LADQGEIQASVVQAAIRKYGIDPNKPNPVAM